MCVEGTNFEFLGGVKPNTEGTNEEAWDHMDGLVEVGGGLQGTVIPRSDTDACANEHWASLVPG